MPMQWDTNNHAKLFAAVIQVANIKLTTAQLSEVAKLMGPECTPKAVTHQLAHMRKRAAEFHDGEDGDEEPKAKKGKGSKVTGGPKKGKKRQVTDTDNEDDGEGAGLISPPASSKKRKTKEVKIKQEDGIEVGEDMGEGLRALGGGGASGGGQGEDDDEGLV